MVRYDGQQENKIMLYSQLATQIRQYIKENQLKSGDKLPGERVLAQKWKVSRSSLREAIRELEKQGVVQVAVGKGTFVSDYEESQKFSIHLATKNFLELFEIKIALERYSIEKATLIVSDDKLDELELMAVQMNEIAATGVMPLEMDHVFHRRLLECYDNREMTNMVCKMTEIYETFDAQLYAYFKKEKFDYHSILLETFPYHLELVRKMKERDVAGALKNYDAIVDLDFKIYRKYDE